MFLLKIGKNGDPQISFIAFCMQFPIATGERGKLKVERELRFTEKSIVSACEETDNKKAGTIAPA